MSGDLGHLKATCEAIVNGGGKIFRWEWDDRLRAALSALPLSDSPRARALLEQHFGQRWDHDSLRGAPPAVLKIATSVGGLHAGQELFLSDSERAVMMCACWWPWANGDAISVRIRLLTEGLPATEEPRLLREFRSWFGL